MKQGIFAVNKPTGITSHDVINILRKKTGERRIGHAGTLDPLAQGVLVVAVGREFTKQLDRIVKSEKEYVAEIFLGQTSSTDDMEGEKKVVGDELKPAKDEIRRETKQFIGKIEQTPPQFSAIKVKGQTAYKAARQGLPLTLEPRMVEVKDIEILSYKYPILKLKIICGKGFYVRSLARDMGEKLKTGGYLKSLLRTKVGEFTIKNAKELDAI